MKLGVDRDTLAQLAGPPDLHIAEIESVRVIVQLDCDIMFRCGEEYRLVVDGARLPHVDQGGAGRGILRRTRSISFCKRVLF